MATSSPGRLYFSAQVASLSANISTSLAKAFLLPTLPHLATGAAQLLTWFPCLALGLASPMEK